MLPSTCKLLSLKLIRKVRWRHEIWNGSNVEYRNQKKRQEIVAGKLQTEQSNDSTNCKRKHEIKMAFPSKRLFLLLLELCFMLFSRLEAIWLRRWLLLPWSTKHKICASTIRVLYYRLRRDSNPAGRMDGCPCASVNRAVHECRCPTRRLVGYSWTLISVQA